MKWLCVATVVLAACGDPIVSGGYRGEALYTIEGWVELSVSPEDLLGAADEDPAELRVALLWSQTKGSSFDLDGAREQEVVTTGSFPARFSVTIYEPPEDAVLRDVTDGTGQLAIGALVAYVDRDGDEHWDRETEDLVGGADERLFLYSPDGVVSALFGTLGAGFHRLVPTTACGGSEVVSASVRYDMDAGDSITLGVDGLFPMSALFDVDCDTSTFDWGGLCPALYEVRERCREGDMVVADEPMCMFCGDQLCPIEWEGNQGDCDAYLLECLDQGNPNWECYGEWHECRGDQPPPPPPRGQHDDLDRTCRDVYDDCRERGDSDQHCRELRDECSEH